ncbi:MAG: hypothetical protein KatS3mg039_0723 [Candidatus Kapaibacterium sp.]|nr:MAG: hypothetical protein KatS3mg039_0723 [Candidatus Kapabacteria bacterium]
MNRFYRRQWLSTGVITMLVVGLSGCTKMIQPDQLAELKQLRAREIQLAQSIRDAESRKQRLERELSSRQDEVKRCKDLQATLQSRLNGFPSNLGEPLAEAPPAPPVQKKGRQK